MLKKKEALVQKSRVIHVKILFKVLNVPKNGGGGAHFVQSSPVNNTKISFEI